MSEAQDVNDQAKTWLLSKVGKIIDVVILQRGSGGHQGKVFWEGQGKVLRCAKPGVVLELQMGESQSWVKRVLHFFPNLGRKYVVRPWEQKRLSVPYADLAIEVNPTTGGTRLIIDAATWRRSPTELRQGKLKGKEDERDV